MPWIDIKINLLISNASSFLQAQIIPEFEALVSAFRSGLKDIGNVANDFNKMTAFDGLSTQLEFKFSQLQVYSIYTTLASVLQFRKCLPFK